MKERKGTVEGADFKDDFLGGLKPLTLMMATGIKGLSRMRMIGFLILILFSSTISFPQSGLLSFDMSVLPAIEKGFNTTRVIATLSKAEYMSSKDFPFYGTTALGLFDNLTPDIYKLCVEIYDKKILIATGSGEGVVSLDDTTYVKARLVVAHNKLILIVDWHPADSVNVEKFYNYSIQTENNHLKLYNDLNNVHQIVSNYQEKMMKWFYPVEVDSSILDTNLVPIRHYDFGDYRNPVTVCNTAFAFYNNYLETGEEINKHGFLNNVDWLLDYHDEHYYLHYEFDWFHYPASHLNQEWISAMAQGEALAAVSMAYFLTREPKYLEAAKGFFKTLYSNTDSFWCIGVDNEEYYWLEEYPNNDFCHVLNGMLFALWGIWDYYVISSDDFALTLFKAGIKTIADNYPKWNVEGEDDSYYCLHYNKYEKYHQVHLNLLTSFAEFFDIPEFHDAVTCFSQEETSAEFVSSNEILPCELVVYQNYPNPFNAETTIPYQLFKNLNLTIKIYNMLGQEVITLANEEHKIGFYRVIWNGKNSTGVDMPGGIYFYKISTNNYVEARKITLLR